MFHWIHHLINPHCHICEKIQQEEFDFEREQFENSKACYSCENLKIELARVHRQNESLIEKITARPEVVERAVDLPIEITKQLPTPWKLKRKLLEDADADRAKVERELRATMGTIKVITEDDLDKELESVKGK